MHSFCTQIKKTTQSNTIQNMKILYGNNEEWKDEIIEKLGGNIKINDPRLKDHYQFRLLAYLFLHLDAAIEDAFDIN